MLVAGVNLMFWISKPSLKKKEVISIGPKYNINIFRDPTCFNFVRKRMDLEEQKQR